MNQALKKSENHIRIGYIMAVVAATLFSIKPIIIKLAYGVGMDAVSLMTCRMLVVFPVYLYIGLYLLRKKTNPIRPITFIQASAVGVLGYYLASILDMKGLEFANAQLERVILYAYPSFVVILGALFFKTPVTKQQPKAMALCYLGICCLFIKDLSTHGNDVITGAILLLLSALSFAFYMLFSKHLINELGSGLFSCIAVGAATLAMLIHAGLVGRLNLGNIGFEPSLYIAVLILALAMGATIIPIFLVSEAIKRLEPANAALTGTIGPVMTSVFAVIILDESFTLMHGVGMVMVVSGVILLSRK